MNDGSRRYPRVLMIVDKAPPNYGGAGAQAVMLAKKLNATGHEVKIVSRRRAAEQDTSLIEFLGIRSRRADSALAHAVFAYCVFIYILRSRTDVVHIHGAFYYGFTGALAARIKKIPLIVKVTLLGKDDPGTVQAMKWHRLPIGRLLFKQFNWAFRIIALNAAIYDEIATVVDPEKVLIVPNGVSDRVLATLRGEKKNAIVFCGIIDSRKGADRLLEAWGKVRAQRPSWRLKLIGPLSGSMASMIEEYLAIPDGRVDYLGQLTQNESWREMSRCKVFALPTLAEGLSNSLIEAMTLGLRCAVSDIPANRSTCGHYATYCNPENHESIVRALLDATDGGPAEAGQASYVDKYKIDSISSVYERVYFDAAAVHEH